jgi:two-component system LytT family response regulator
MNFPLKTILIDDESLATNRLSRLLSAYSDVCKIIAQASNGQMALELIEKLKPDLIFLDIEMPVLNGFQVLSQLSYMPYVVFATAYQEYAIRAFEENSIDYLLKPIEPERLALTIQKIKNLPSFSVSPNYNQQIWQVLQQMQVKKEITAIPVKIGDRILLIRLEEIAYLEAEDKYVNLFTLDNKKYLIDYSLNTLTDKLPSHFVRISRSVMVNQYQIKEIQKYFNGKYTLLLNDTIKTKLTSGTSFSENIKKMFEI